MESSLIWVTASKPINAKTHSGEKIFQPGEAFQVNPVKAKPLIEKKMLKEVMAPLDGLTEGCSSELDPIEALDEFWSQDILPRLSRLHMAGRLNDLSMCPLWNEVDRFWQEKPLRVEKVKQAMTSAIEAYERAPNATKPGAVSSKTEKAPQKPEQKNER